MKSEKRKLLISCFWACWSKAMCSLGSLFQTCRPHAQVLSCSARIFAHVPLWIYPFLFEILYFAVTPKLAEGGEIAALGIAGAKAQTLVLTWEDPVRGWKFWGAGDCWRSALEAQQDNLSPDNLSVWWGRSFAVKHNLCQPMQYLMVHTLYPSCIYRLFALWHLGPLTSLSLTSPGLCSLPLHPALPQVLGCTPRQLAPGGIFPKIQENRKLAFNWGGYSRCDFIYLFLILETCSVRPA